METKRFLSGEVPPELIFLSHHQRESSSVSVFPSPRDMSHHSTYARCRVDHTGEQFQWGGFACAVGAKEGDEFTLVHGEVDTSHGIDLTIFSTKQPFDRGREPFPLLIDAVGLHEVFNFDDGHGREQPDRDGGSLGTR